ncbi:hypothetical protein BCR42DRAFT_428933 [Absidia repens]|uniref:Uncharacterized protein n=1 Tax=Absidia repens TaxID=90262 RepID=A0A1X2HXX6_9FUNG|nr:hypothetical protein BCR42DRAFT_428933 [Absidia repens]
MQCSHISCQPFVLVTRPNGKIMQQTLILRCLRPVAFQHIRSYAVQPRRYRQAQHEMVYVAVPAAAAAASRHSLILGRAVPLSHL